MPDIVFSDPTNFFTFGGSTYRDATTNAPANRGDANSVFTWTSTNFADAAQNLTDVDGDGQLVAGVDFWFNNSFTFVGNTVTVDGV